MRMESNFIITAVFILSVPDVTTLRMSLTDVAMLADGCRADLTYKTSISDIVWKNSLLTSKAEFPDRVLLVFLHVMLFSGVYG